MISPVDTFKGDWDQTLSCSTIHSGVVFFQGSETLSPFEVRSQHLPFIGVSRDGRCLSATWPFSYTGPMVALFYQNGFDACFGSNIFEWVVILVWGRYLLSVLHAEVTKTRYPRHPTPATAHRGALRYTWRISPINSSMSKFGGFSLSLCGLSWFSPFYLLDTGLSQAFDISATILCFSRMRYPIPATANRAVGYNTVS